MAGDAYKEASDKINDLLAELAEKEVDLNGNICTGWFIVTEWLDGDNSYEIVGWGDGAHAPWKYDGMLNYAIAQELAYETDDIEED